MEARTVPTFCRICEPQCGLLVHVEGDRVVDITGDPDHPLSRGFACGKGIAMREIQRDPDRMLQPLRRTGGPGEFEPVGWDEAIADIAARLTTVLDTYGPTAFAIYAGNPRAFSFGHGSAVSNLLRAMPTHHLYGPMAQDGGARLAATALLYGSPAVLPIPDLAHTSYLLMLGSNPFVSHGSMISDPRIADTLRGIIERGGEVVVVDPRRTETARAFDHLPIRAGTDPWFLLSLLHVIIERDDVDHPFIDRFTTGFDELTATVREFSPETTEQITGVPAARVRQIAHTFAAADTGIVFGRTGTCTQRFGTLANVLQDLLNIVTGNVDRPGGWIFGWSPMDFEAATKRAGRDTYGAVRSRVGNLPDVIANLPGTVLAAEITTPGEGQIHALLTTGGNPVMSVPDPDALEGALALLDLHVSFDLYVTETNRWADYVLPVPTFLERGDVQLMSTESAIPFIQVTEPVVSRAGDTREEWEILRDLADAMGRPELSLPADPRTLVDGLLAEAGLSWAGLATDHPHGLVIADRQKVGVLAEKISHPNGRIPLVHPEIAIEIDRLEAAEDPEFPLRLIGLREARTHNSWMHNAPMLTLGRRRPTPSVRVHPDDASNLGVVDGEMVVLRSRSGAVEVPVAVTDEMTPGNVAYPHGWGHQGGWEVANAAGGVNVNRLSSARVEDLERLAAMAVLNGVQVRIERTAHAAPA